MKILSDLHIHTSASLCCNDKEQTFSNIVEIVKNIGLKQRMSTTWQRWQMREDSIFGKASILSVRNNKEFVIL